MLTCNCMPPENWNAGPEVDCTWRAMLVDNGFQVGQNASGVQQIAAPGTRDYSADISKLCLKFLPTALVILGIP